MHEFQLSRDRDAYFVLRGFRYQIDLTILRWLELLHDQILELERGEDIDLVVQSLGHPAEELARQLQQVKLRNSSVTLRSAPVIEALANAFEHRRANPRLELSFTFVTNASAGVERSSPISDIGPGIAVWEFLRTNNAAEEKTRPLVQAVRSILLSARRPSSLNRQTWRDFRTFVNAARPDELLALMRAFQWQVGQPNANELALSVPQRLVSLGISPNLVDAADLHARLFLHVMHVITQPGLKRLTRGALDALTSLPPLSDQDRETLSIIQNRLFRLEERFAGLELTVAQQQATVNLIQSELQSHIAAEGVAAQVLPVFPILSTSLPPKVLALCDRRDTVATLGQGVAERTWTALYGSTGIGKTQLSTLVAEATGRVTAHLSLRDLSSAQAYFRLCGFLTQIGVAPEGTSFEELLSAAVTQIGAAPLIVVDDVPHLDGHDQLSAAMRMLAQRLADCGGRLITTSYFPLPAPVLEHFAESAAVNVPCPPFRDDEAVELFAEYSAPQNFRDSGNVRLINIFARGNAALLAGYARNLANRNWEWDASDIELLKAHHHAQDVIDEAVRRLLETVSDPQTRELLYRLCPVLGQFTQREIEAVAQVEPVIDRPRERLIVLTGLWIEQRPEGRLAVSPIVKPLSESELAADVRKAVFAALGDSVIGRRSLTVLEFGEAALYLERSENYTRLGLFLIGALSSSSGLPAEQLAHLLLVSKPVVPLPLQMDLTIRILLRAQQIQVAHRLGQSVTWLLDDLDQLIERSDENDKWAVYLASATTIFVAAENDFPRSLRFFDLVLKLQDTVVALLSAAGEAPARIDGFDAVSPANVVWINTTGIKTVADLGAWLSFLENLDDETLRTVFSHDRAEAGSVFVIDRPWMRERDKPIDQRNWEAIIEAYDGVIAFAERRGLEPIWSAATRMKIICLAEDLGVLETALQIAESAVAHPLCGSASQFLVRDAIGRQLLLQGCKEEAVTWLTSALKDDFHPFPVIAVRSFLEASRAVGDTDPPLAADLARRATEFARSQPTEVPEVEMAAALAEYGHALALDGKSPDAFAPFDESAERLLNCGEDTDPWKQRFVMLGVTLKSVLSRVIGGPSGSDSSGGDNAIPARGAIMNPHQDCTRFYDEQNFDVTGIGSLCALLATYAQAIGNEGRCANWALRGLDESRSSGQLDSLGILGQQAFPFLAIRGQVAEALEVAYESIVAIDQCRAMEAAGLSFGDPKAIATDVLGEKPGPRWDELERIAAQSGLLPILMEIGRTAITDADLATASGESLAEALSAMAETASTPELWEEASQIVNDIFVAPVDEEALHTRGTEAGKAERHEAHMLAYLGCTLVRNATLERSALYHAIVFHQLFKTLTPRASGYSLLALPFLCSYWKHMLQTQRFRFSTPTFVEEQLAEAVDAPIESRAQRVLSVVLNGLRQNCPENLVEVKAWLRAEWDR